MAVTYPFQSIGKFRLGMGFNYKCLHRRFGADFGETFHRDPEFRMQTLQDLDREVYRRYGKLGLGFESPAPRLAVEPFGHRFMPVMYGCRCRYAPDAEPWAEEHVLSDADIRSLKLWTKSGFAKAEPVREIVRQAGIVRRKYGACESMQNLGSVINTAVSIRGEQMFVDYIENPDLLKILFHHTTELMMLAVDFFEALEGIKVRSMFLGNCSVSMISPEQYQAVNREHDEAFIRFAGKKGAEFLIHQDSNVTPHLADYAQHTYVKKLDIGMDTDFETAARYFAHADVNCIWFPHWIIDHTPDEIDREVERLMKTGRRFKSFSFTLYEIDEMIPDDKLFDFHDSVVRHARD